MVDFQWFYCFKKSSFPVWYSWPVWSWYSSNWLSLQLSHEMGMVLWPEGNTYRWDKIKFPAKACKAKSTVCASGKYKCSCAVSENGFGTTKQRKEAGFGSLDCSVTRCSIPPWAVAIAGVIFPFNWRISCTRMLDAAFSAMSNSSHSKWSPLEKGVGSPFGAAHTKVRYPFSAAVEFMFSAPNVRVCSDPVAVLNCMTAGSNWMVNWKLSRS